MKATERQELTELLEKEKDLRKKWTRKSKDWQNKYTRAHMACGEAFQEIERMKTNHADQIHALENKWKNEHDSEVTELRNEVEKLQILNSSMHRDRAELRTRLAQEQQRRLNDMQQLQLQHKEKMKYQHTQLSKQWQDKMSQEVFSKTSLLRGQLRHTQEHLKSTHDKWILCLQEVDKLKHFEEKFRNLNAEVENLRAFVNQLENRANSAEKAVDTTRYLFHRMMGAMCVMRYRITTKVKRLLRELGQIMSKLMVHRSTQDETMAHDQAVTGNGQLFPQTELENWLRNTATMLHLFSMRQRKQRGVEEKADSWTQKFRDPSVTRFTISRTSSAFSESMNQLLSFSALLRTSVQVQILRDTQQDEQIKGFFASNVALSHALKAKSTELQSTQRFANAFKRRLEYARAHIRQLHRQMHILVKITNSESTGVDTSSHYHKRMDGVNKTYRRPMLLLQSKYSIPADHSNTLTVPGSAMGQSLGGVSSSGGLSFHTVEMRCRNPELVHRWDDIVADMQQEVGTHKDSGDESPGSVSDSPVIRHGHRRSKSGASTLSVGTPRVSHTSTKSMLKSPRGGSSSRSARNNSAMTSSALGILEKIFDDSFVNEKLEMDGERRHRTMQSLTWKDWNRITDVSQAEEVALDDSDMLEDRGTSFAQVRAAEMAQESKTAGSTDDASDRKMTHQISVIPPEDNDVVLSPALVSPRGSELNAPLPGSVEYQMRVYGKVSDASQAPVESLVSDLPKLTLAEAEELEYRKHQKAEMQRFLNKTQNYEKYRKQNLRDDGVTSHTRSSSKSARASEKKTQSSSQKASSKNTTSKKRRRRTRKRRKRTKSKRSKTRPHTATRTSTRRVSHQPGHKGSIHYVPSKDGGFVKKTEGEAGSHTHMEAELCKHADTPTYIKSGRSRFNLEDRQNVAREERSLAELTTRKPRRSPYVMTSQLISWKRRGPRAQSAGTHRSSYHAAEEKDGEESHAQLPHPAASTSASESEMSRSDARMYPSRPVSQKSDRPTQPASRTTRPRTAGAKQSRRRGHEGRSTRPVPGGNSSVYANIGWARRMKSSRARFLAEKRLQMEARNRNRKGGREAGGGARTRELPEEPAGPASPEELSGWQVGEQQTVEGEASAGFSAET